MDLIVDFPDRNEFYDMTPMETIAEAASVDERSSLHHSGILSADERGSSGLIQPAPVLLSSEAEAEEEESVVHFSNVYICEEVTPIGEMDDLLVDFPSRRRRRRSSCSSATSEAFSYGASSHDDASSRDDVSTTSLSWIPSRSGTSVTSVTPSPPRGVSFAARTQVTFVDNLTHNYKSDLWLTESDIQSYMIEKSKHVKMIKILQRFSSSGAAGGNHRIGSSGNVSNTGSNGSGSNDSTRSNNNSNSHVVSNSTMAKYITRRIDNADTTPIGIEAYVDPHVSMTEINFRREEHNDAVLDEQWRQMKGQQGPVRNDPVALAEVSRIASEWARERAAEIGRGHAEDEDGCKAVAERTAKEQEEGLLLLKLRRSITGGTEGLTSGEEESTVVVDYESNSLISRASASAAAEDGSRSSRVENRRASTDLNSRQPSVVTSERTKSLWAQAVVGSLATAAATEGKSGSGNSDVSKLVADDGQQKQQLSTEQMPFDVKEFVRKVSSSGTSSIDWARKRAQKRAEVIETLHRKRTDREMNESAADDDEDTTDTTAGESNSKSPIQRRNTGIPLLSDDEVVTPIRNQTHAVGGTMQAHIGKIRNPTPPSASNMGWY